MARFQTQRFSMMLKTNLLWIITVKIVLVVLYLSEHSSDKRKYVYNNELHTTMLDYNSNELLVDSKIKTEIQSETGVIGDSLTTILEYNSNELLVDSKIKTEIHSETVVTGDCKGLLFPVHLSPEVRWRPVNKNQTAFVFSLYYMKDKRKLVIIGAKIKDYSTYYCQLWYRRDEYHSFKMEQRTTRVIGLPEGHDRRYTATLFECLVTSSTLPDFVSVVNESCGTPFHIFEVDQSFIDINDKRLFTVCLSPLHNDQFDGANELVEWIELNKILGAERFIVYNSSSSIKVKQVLDFYTKQGTTEVVQRRLPTEVDSNHEIKHTVDIHYFGQIAALNDCLYRSKSHSEFIVNIDLDEFIIPHSKNAKTWSDMLEILFSIKRKVYTAYLFRNTFFRKEWNSTNRLVLNKEMIENYRLTTLQKLERENNIYPIGIRSKYIARTSEVFSLMIHDVRGLSSSKRLGISPKIGLLHHYRHCEDVCLATADRVLDKTVVNKYGRSLVHNIQNVILNLQKQL